MVGESIKVQCYLRQYRIQKLKMIGVMTFGGSIGTLLST